MNIKTTKKRLLTLILFLFIFITALFLFYTVLPKEKLEILQYCNKITNNKYECKVFIDEYYLNEEDLQCMLVLLPSGDVRGETITWCEQKDSVNWDNPPPNFRLNVPVTITIDYKEKLFRANVVEKVDIELMDDSEAWELANSNDRLGSEIFFRKQEEIELETLGYYVVTSFKEDGTRFYQYFATPYTNIMEYTVDDGTANFVLSFEHNGKEKTIQATGEEIKYRFDLSKGYEPVGLEEFKELINPDITYQFFFSIKGEETLTEEIVESYLNSESTEGLFLVNRLSPNE